MDSLGWVDRLVWILRFNKSQPPWMFNKRGLANLEEKENHKKKGSGEKKTKFIENSRLEMAYPLDLG